MLVDCCSSVRECAEGGFVLVDWRSSSRECGEGDVGGLAFLQQEVWSQGRWWTGVIASVSVVRGVLVDWRSKVFIVEINLFTYCYYINSVYIRIRHFFLQPTYRSESFRRLCTEESTLKIN